MEPTGIVTVGHGSLETAAFADLVRAAGVSMVVDVRRFPGSRRHPQFGQDDMRSWLGEAGVSYRWDEDLGGFRKARSGSPNMALRHASFRGYADYMSEAPFTSGVDRLVDDARRGAGPVAVMCAEALWWRCHRRLIADHLVLVRHEDVRHLMHNGTLAPHRPTDVARLSPDGTLVYDGGQGPLLSVDDG
jgi:uncharacterized protein (DUF488 family)